MKLFLAASLLFMAGCDLFSTRTPDPPNSSNTFIWTPATTTDFLIDNFTGTLKVLDASNYMRVFISAADSTGSGVKSYTFTPAGSDPTTHAFFATWTVESERSWLAKLQTFLPKNSQLTVLLSNPQFQAASPSSASYSADYTISIPVPASSSNVIPSVVEGSLQMQLLLVTTEQGTKEWRIVSWTDTPPKTATTSTWTDLKLKLAS